MDDSVFKRTEYNLYNYKSLEIKIKNIDIDLEELEDDISLKSVGYEERTGPTNAFSSSVENEVVKRDKLRNQLLLEKKKCIRLQNKIKNALETLTKEERQLIDLRYMGKEKLTWIQIGLILGRDKDNCMKLRNRIIGKVTDYLFRV